MKNELRHFFQKLDGHVDSVRKQMRPFQEALDITGYAYVRVYDDGRLSWLTSDSDHDRLLVDTGFLEEDPLIDTSKSLNEGKYLWFHNRSFPGSCAFYKRRQKIFHIDHGMVLVKRQKSYIETSCFSGLLKKRALYNLFMNETGLFYACTEQLKRELSKSQEQHLEEGILLSDIKPCRAPFAQELVTKATRHELLKRVGLGALLTLSKRELECLSHLRCGKPYAEIGNAMHLSARTVEHYIESIKNKFDIESRSQLLALAAKIAQAGI